MLTGIAAFLGLAGIILLLWAFLPRGSWRNSIFGPTNAASSDSSAPLFMNDSSSFPDPALPAAEAAGNCSPDSGDSGNSDRGDLGSCDSGGGDSGDSDSGSSSE